MTTLRERVALRPEAAAPVAARAVRVEEITTPLGVRAYLIREPALPVPVPGLHIRGGGRGDPAGREGLAYMGAGLLDEGAGPYDSQAFRRELEDHAIRLRSRPTATASPASCGRSPPTASTPSSCCASPSPSPASTRSRWPAGARPDPAELRRREAEPDYLASRAWFARAFPDHPYGRPTRGTPESVAAIDRRGLTTFAAPPPRPRQPGGRRRRRHHGRRAGPLAGPRLRRPAGHGRAPGGPGRGPARRRHRDRAASRTRRAWSPSGMPACRATTPTTTPPTSPTTSWAAAASARGCSRRSARSAASPTRSIPTSTTSTTRPLWLGGVATKNEQVAERCA